VSTRSVQYVPIGDLIVPIRSWNPLASATNSSIDYIDIASIDRESKLITASDRIECHDAPSRARQLVEEDDVLVATVRPNLNAVAIVPKALAGATASTGFCVLRCQANRLCPRYLFHWVQTPEFVRAMIRRATGASYPAVSDRIVYQSTIPLPHLQEQHRIASILSLANAILRKRQIALRVADDLLSAIFYELFGSISQHGAKFPVQPLRPYLSAASGKSSKEVLSPEPTGIPIYGGNGRNGWAYRALYNEPVIVVGRVGQQCGISKMTDGPAWITDNAIVVKVEDTTKVHPVYLEAALRRSALGSTVNYIDLPFINQSIVLDHPLPLPPMEVQLEYVNRKTVHTRLVQKLENAELESRNLFDGLVQRAFRGEL
jgi:type I restriction enzyme, S subunit